MRLAGPIDLLKRWLKHLAPAGTRRRRLVLHGLALYQRLADQPLLRALLNRLVYVSRPLDIYDPPLFNAFVSRCGVGTSDTSARAAETDVSGAARLILGLLQERPDLRRQFPQAIREGSEGDFCQWLCRDGRTLFNLSSRAVDHIRSAFARRLGDRVRQCYDHRQDLRQSFPLALTPLGQRSFLAWLLRCGRFEHDLDFEEIWWFLNECSEDASRGLAATYLLTPHWQRLFPHGLTIFGFPELLAWVGKEYGGKKHFRNLDPPALFSPADELRLLYQASPELQALAPRAFRDVYQTTLLLKAVQEKYCNRLSGADAWWDRLHDNVTDGMVDQVGANVIGHFCNPSGLRQAALATARSLHRVGVRTSCRDIPVKRADSAQLRADDPNRSPFLGLELFDTTLLHLAPQPLVDYFYPLAGLDIRPDVYRIAVWFWELETIPPEWIRHAGVIQEIWAPSQFIARAMQERMPVPVVHMPPGVELGPVPSLPRFAFGLPDDRFLFLFLFDMNSVMERKNPLGLIRAFRQAFGDSDRAQLVIKITQGEANPQDLRRLVEAAGSAGVTIIDRVLSRGECYGLMNACDCCVSLHRAEGFGFTLAEAMLLGKPAIATGYSGNLDFMTADNSLLVDYRRVPILEDLPFYPKGSVWAEPCVDHAARQMRWVYENQEAARALGARGRLEAERLLSPEAAGRRMRSRLEELSTTKDTKNAKKRQENELECVR